MAQGSYNGRLSNVPDEGDEFRFSSDMSLEEVRDLQNKFCRERQWGQFHAPRNVLLAMVGEVGELSELFQWKGEVQRGLPEFSSEEKVQVGEEMADVLIYLCDLAEQCKIDLPQAVRDKFQKNAQKYPSGRVFGRSNKYNDYTEYKEEQAPVTLNRSREREEADGSE
ncbi:unnamed protein product [Meganyctiphanes norvegica]|uniref:dCTP pyrophosphatase 1 n=1 Tax=Meganyctiphanes norvegica TaxID=48144 RepID=A0AAV2Q8A4_MEGNR